MFTLEQINDLHARLGNAETLFEPRVLGDAEREGRKWGHDEYTPFSRTVYAERAFHSGLRIGR